MSRGVTAAAILAAIMGSESMAMAQQQWLFEDRLMIAVDGAERPRASPTTPEFVPFDKAQLSLEPMFDVPVEPAVSVTPTKSFRHGLDETPAVLRRWFTLDLANAGARAFGIAGPAETPSTRKENPWDIAHAIVDSYANPETNRAFTDAMGGIPSVVEPDIIYLRPGDERLQALSGSFPSPLPPAAARALATASATAPGLTEEPSTRWPAGASFAWHLYPGFTDLKAARESAAPYFSGRDSVRIAHLDTGWDVLADQVTPRNFCRAEARNFIAKEDPQDSRDRVGHGTGTLGLLAGGRVAVDWNGAQFNDDLGGAPLAWVTSYRISNSVVHIWPTAMSKAIAWAADHAIDVISMSAGGAPSLALRDAVNKAYERGTAMAFAAGDFLRLPIPWFEFFETPPWTVYPARFTRAISVTGITQAHKSYGHDPGFWSFFHLHGLTSWMLRGSYGPTRLAPHTIAAYSPNMARHSVPSPASMNRVGMAFAGTSASTPQVAATAALWLQRNRPDLEQKRWWRSWQKAQVVYDALLQGADSTFAGYAPLEFGRGALRSAATLAMPVGNPQKADAATIGFDWISFIAMIIAPGNFDPAVQQQISLAHLQMFSSEVAQLVNSSKTLQEAVSAKENAASSGASFVEAPHSMAAVAAAIRRDPRASRTLVAALDPEMAHLAINESRTFRIRAHPYLNHTKLFVFPGETYAIAPKKGQRWVDFFISCGSKGYQWSWTDRFKTQLRNPHATFFALMVTVADDEGASQPVTTHEHPTLHHFEPMQRGELTFFANDLKGWYWNNWGAIEVQVTRKR
jgi:subtilisin family serine protease